MILGVDPGDTSGWIKVQVDFVKLRNGSSIDECVEIVDSGEFSDIHGFSAAKNDMFGLLTRVIVENYVIYPNRAQTHAGQTIPTIRIIGWIEWYAYWIGGLRIILQTASEAKQRWPDKRLNRHFPELVGGSRHIRDALRHVLTYAEKRSET
jgi:hypothetical protein